MKRDISVSVSSVPHPDPDQLIELWSRLVLKELLKKDQEVEETNHDRYSPSAS